MPAAGAGTRAAARSTLAGAAGRRRPGEAAGRNLAGERTTYRMRWFSVLLLMEVLLFRDHSINVLVCVCVFSVLASQTLAVAAKQTLNHSASINEKAKENSLRGFEKENNKTTRK